MMIRTLWLPCILVIASTGYAAEVEIPLGGGSLEPPTDGPCLSPEQRAEIWARIERNRSELRAEGRLGEPERGAVVLFDWPLAASPAWIDYGYHGISNFVDQDPDYPNEVLDYNCGSRTYDLDTGYNHRGIDYYSAPFGWYMMDNDRVWAVAAAPGVIMGKDDGNYDRSCGFGSGDWNAVYVEHADGSVTWYGHLKSGSLTPKEMGDTVEAGEFLGVVGSSGNSTGPHLHFETYDGMGDLIEPYEGPCNMLNGDSWWQDQRPYYDSALNALKTHDGVPEFPTCPDQEIPHERDAFTPGSQVYFVLYYRDEVPDEDTGVSVLRPDQSEAWSWTHSSTDYRSSSYWYWDRTLPDDAPEGLWTFRATYGGIVYEHPFSVCSGDDSAPVIQCPDDIVVECNGEAGTTAYDPALWPFFYGVSATDGCDPTPSIVNDAPAFFPFGSTVVTFTATDDFGNQSSCSATVTIEDSTMPEITCPTDITVECSAAGGTPKDDPQLAEFFATPVATDNCDSSPLITNDAPDLFPDGATVVTFTATDDSGNQGTCTATVTVEDTTPPELTVTLNRYALWPPNHRLSTILADVTVTDICDPDASFVLTSIESDEPDNGQGDGDTEGDIQGADFGTADTEFQLRSERMGSGDGRVYTILYTASDASGNTASQEVEVHVPHDQDGMALAGTGFDESGTGFEAGVETFTLVIPSTPEVSAEGIVVDRAYVGNHVGALTPLAGELRDATGDGLVDLELTYDVEATQKLAVLSQGFPVGMHYEHEERGNFAVADIFDLAPAPAGLEDLPAPTAASLGARPNPFAGSTTISYAVPGGAPARVSIEVYNIAGQRVRRLVDDYREPGSYSLTWDGATDDGARVPAGIYLQRAVIGDEEKTQRLVIIQ